MELIETEIIIKLPSSKIPEGLIEAIRNLLPNQEVFILLRWGERIDK